MSTPTPRTNSLFELTKKYPVLSDGLTDFHVLCIKLERELQQAQAALAAVTLERPKIAPVQGYAAGIPWEMHLRAYDAYCKRWSPQPAMIDLEGRNCRGGFSTEELDGFIPGWREELSVVAQLRAQLAACQSREAKALMAVDHIDAAAKQLLSKAEADRDQLQAQVGLLRDALEKTNEWIDGHVSMTSGDHENAPEPADTFSFEAGSVISANMAVLAKPTP